MKLNKNVGIYYNTSNIKIDLIVQYCRKNYKDIIVFDNNNHYISSDIMVVPQFYSKFFQGDIIYFEYNDFIKNTHNSLQNSILYLDFDKIGSLEINMIKNHNILYIENNEVIMKDYKYELQQLIR